MVSRALGSPGSRFCRTYNNVVTSPSARGASAARWHDRCLPCDTMLTCAVALATYSVKTETLDIGGYIRLHTVTYGYIRLHTKVYGFGPYGYIRFGMVHTVWTIRLHNYESIRFGPYGYIRKGTFSGYFVCNRMG